MVKLRDAKCPNCGANMEVNEALEKNNKFKKEKI